MVNDGAQYNLDDRSEIRIVGGRFYTHKTVQINYTTYDMRREYDIVNPRKHADIMTASPNLDVDTGTSTCGHPFAYAQVLGIYHADVVRIGSGHSVSTHTVEFLYVNWYRRDVSFKAGFKHRRMHRLQLMPASENNACGFLDPGDVIRGCHIIPAFACGQIDSDEITDTSRDSPQWRYHYVNLYVVYI